LSAAQERFPQDFWLNFELGRAWHGDGKNDQAIGFYRAALALRLEAGLVHCALGTKLFTIGQFDEAIRQLKQAVEIEPDIAIFHNNFGMALGRKGELDAAMRHFEEAIRLDPKESAGAHLNLGAVLFETGRVEEAIDQFQQAVQLNPGLTEAYEALRRTFASRREWKKAADCYARDLKRSPTNDGHAWFEYTAVLLLSGDRPGYEKACAHMIGQCGKASNLRPFHVARACTLAPDAVAEPSLPSRLAEKELQAAGKVFWSLTEQGALSCRAGRFPQAVALFEESLRADSVPGRSVLNWLWLALAQHRLGKSEEARRSLDKATAWLDRYPNGMPSRAPQEVGLDLHNWLEAHVLRREAESLIRPAAPH
jgi:tetratricopeptide (TPR) repeat protein